MNGRESFKPYLPGAFEGELRSAGGPEADRELIASEVGYIADSKGAEAPHIAALRDSLRDGTQPPDRSYLVGLALSGGGIRSATFSLGVMQRLARAPVLRHVDFLSTVSGGGYIGAALSWWLSRQTGSGENFDLAKNFPYGTDDPKNAGSDDNRLLVFLRRNGKYLIPGGGITVWSGVAVVLRAVLLNLLVWIPIIAGLFLLLRWLGTLPILNGMISMVGMLAPGVVSDIVLLISPTNALEADQVMPPVFLLFLLLAVLLIALFLVSSINYSLLSWMGRGESDKRQVHVERKGVLKDPHHSVLKLVGRWLLVGLLGLADLVALFLLVQGLGALTPALFGGESPETLAGGLASQWPWGVAVLAAAVLLYFYVSRHDELVASEWQGFAHVFAAIGALFVMDGLLAGALRWGLPQNFLWGTVNLGWLAGLIQVVALVGLFVFLNFWIAYLIRWLLRREGLSIRYGGRRLFERAFGYVVLGVIGLLVLGSIPLVVAWIGERYAGVEGVLSLVAGVASAFWGHLKSQQKSADGRGTRLILIVGSLVFLYGLALVGYLLALRFQAGDAELRMAFTGLFIVAVLTGWFSNVNYISLHRFYRDRLTEAFLADREAVDKGVLGPARRADDLRIADLWREPAPRGPYHIVNTNLVLVNAVAGKHRSRGGDNFILSPLYSGSAATGWQRTEVHMGGEMTLASAVATSGAAANPRSGPGGRGITRNPFVSLVMSLLNFRLGYWTVRPGPGKALFKRANHFWPSGLYSIFNAGHRETSAMVELTDGAHFENLAIYELVRRRCGLIVVCDGGQDIEASYADFVTAIQRIGQDFGATVSFDMEVAEGGDGAFVASGPERVIARKAEGLYPGKADYADKGYFLASVDYGERGGGPWPRKGLIIYLKTTMISALSMAAKGYKGANPDFPDETTADQFFDEEQFEAYRELGYRIAEQVVDDLALDELFQDRPPLGRLAENERFRRRPGATGQ